jgi:Kelch motif
MPFSSYNPPANGIASQSTQQPQPVCTWSAHAPKSGSSPSPLPRNMHSLTGIATAAGELFLFGGYDASSSESSDLYVISTRDFSTTILQTSGEVPTPRWEHGTALIGTTLLICGGDTRRSDDATNVPLYLLNLGTSDPLMSSPTPADHGFALQNRESGLGLWLLVPGRAVVAYIPQRWSVPSSSSSVVSVACLPPMICGHSI